MIKKILIITFLLLLSSCFYNSKTEIIQNNKYEEKFISVDDSIDISDIDYDPDY